MVDASDYKGVLLCYNVVRVLTPHSMHPKYKLYKEKVAAYLVDRLNMRHPAREYHEAFTWGALSGAPLCSFADGSQPPY
jgi:hypothetical protein